MASRYSSSEIFQLQTDADQFRQWDANEPDTDFAAHSKKCLMVAIESELTVKQRQYYTMYHLEGMTMEAIAKKTGVTRSAVSRSIKAAKKKLARCLRYSAPHLLNAPVQARNRRS